jgi:7-carboxy-7-deazaguanine synthase
MEKEFKKTQIETNGTQWQPIPDSTILVCSPKCTEGLNPHYLHPHPKVLERADCLKFVMCADENSPYRQIPDWAHEWRKRGTQPIFISPMNIYNKEPEKARRMRAEKGEGDIDERSTVDEVVSFWEPGLLNMEANKRNHEYAARYCIDHGLTFNVQIHLLASVA